MSKPDLDIIHSPEAKTFLRSVTEGFYNRSYLGLWIYEVIGREWDEMAQWSADLKQEIFVQTCTWSIAIWEWVYGFEPDESMTLEERRQRILNRVRMVRPINPEVLRRGIAAVSGADVEVTDFTSPYTFSVTLNITNRPIPSDRVFQYISKVKPAHLAVSTKIIFPTIPNTVRLGGCAASHIRFPIPEQADTISFQGTVRIGGGAAAMTRLPVAQQADDIRLQGTIRAGGSATPLVRFPVPEDTAAAPVEKALRTGGQTVACVIVPVPEQQ